uniref:CSON004449 protein n=1 Tax=Culicoides sonorensis TaxID=179676 RepID=A0A336LF36_CULSO
MLGQCSVNKPTFILGLRGNCVVQCEVYRF